MKPVIVTGTLREAFFMDGILYGKVYGDINKRFEDGTSIHTSRVTFADKDGFCTLNSLYKVETWA